MRDDSGMLVSITHRTSLMAQAITACSSLSTILDQMGPSRLIKSLALPDGVGAECADMLLELSKLEDTLQRTLQSVNEHLNNALPPVARLSDDVLRVIFTFATADERLKSFRQATSISHVSSRWRTIALDTPRIWAHVSLPQTLEHRHFGLPNFPSSLHPWYDADELSARDAWRERRFERSKAAPLAVILTIGMAREEGPRTSELFLSMCSARVEHLTIRIIDAPDFIRLLMPCIMATKSVLRTLDVSVLREKEYGAELHSTAAELFYSDFPVLTDFTVSGLRLPTTSTEPYVALRHCTRIQLTGYDEDNSFIDGFVLLLNSCPELRAFNLMASFHPPQIHVGHPFQTQPAPFQPDTKLVRVCAPKLESLSIDGTGFIKVPLAILSAPRLSKLDLRHFSASNHGPFPGLHLGMPPTEVAEDVQDPALLAALQQFLRTSAASVKCLRIGTFPFALEDILPLVPDITSLTFTPARRSSPEYYNLLQAISNPAQGDGEPMCQRLEELNFPEWNTSSADLQSLRDFARDRRIEGQTETRPLLRIRLGCFGDIPASPLDSRRTDEEQLAENVETLVVEELGLGALGQKQWTFVGATKTWKRTRTPVTQTHRYRFF